MFYNFFVLDFYLPIDYMLRDFPSLFNDSLSVWIVILSEFWKLRQLKHLRFFCHCDTTIIIPAVIRIVLDRDSTRRSFLKIVSKTRVRVSRSNMTAIRTISFEFLVKPVKPVKHNQGGRHNQEEDNAEGTFLSSICLILALDIAREACVATFIWAAWITVSEGYLVSESPFVDDLRPPRAVFALESRSTTASIVLVHTVNCDSTIAVGAATTSRWTSAATASTATTASTTATTQDSVVISFFESKRELIFMPWLLSFLFKREERVLLRIVRFAATGNCK